MTKLKILFTFLALFIFFTRVSFAQNEGITVTPSIIHLDLSSDLPQYSLTYINNTKTQVNLSLSVQDFTELEEGYKINFLDQKDASNYKYSLSSWVSFENRELQLSPGEKKSVNIFIDKNRITKGGHYASILAEVLQPQNQKDVNVKAVLSSLLFVRASSGKEIEDGSVSTFTPLRDGFEFPKLYLLRFENKGNVHVVPYGLLTVYDSGGNKIGKGILNEGSLDALPESIRRYDIKLDSSQKVLLPGFYTATLSMHFGKTDKKLEAKAKFFSYGSFDPMKISIGFILIFIVLVYLKRRKRS